MRAPRASLTPPSPFQGGAVMEHVFMSEWWEWPTMFQAKSVPFAATHEGGQIKCLGNPVVWLGVFGNFCVCTVAGLLFARHAVMSAGKPAAAVEEGAVELDRRGWAIPFFVLWSGYLLNLVPYQLIKRSKFVYHYIPALMVGVLLFAFALEAVWGWAGRSKSAAPTRVAQLITVALFSLVSFGFYFWGLPFAYGLRISPADSRARLWSDRW
jgi:dolichyl-phosphate-mannose--protein O-mannosyl transferase